jgi:hypothetical protein
MVFHLAYAVQQGINYRITDHLDIFSRDPFPLEVCPGILRWAKVEIRKVTGHNPVHLFRKGCILIETSEAGFNMGDFDTAIIGGKGGSKDRGRIALNNDPIRLVRLDDAP